MFHINLSRANLLLKEQILMLGRVRPQLMVALSQNSIWKVHTDICMFMANATLFMTCSSFLSSLVTACKVESLFL